jgi:hypothetical protein
LKIFRQKLKNYRSSVRKLVKLAGNFEDNIDSEGIYYGALERLYELFLQKTLRDGGKCKDLVATSLEAFGLLDLK